MRAKRLLLAASIAIPWGGAGAQPAPSPPSGTSSSCAAEKARSAVGQPYSDALAEQARREAGARVARKIEPGRAYTMEFLDGRLNLEVDGRDVVQRLRCG